MNTKSPGYVLLGQPPNTPHLNLHTLPSLLPADEFVIQDPFHQRQRL